MKILCQKCKQEFDPEFETAHCSPYYGHAPVAPSGQRLPKSLLEIKEKNKPAPKFQSDFKLIWDEPDR